MNPAPLLLLIPGNMCDARLWDADGGAIRAALAAATGRTPADADTSQDDTIAAMAERALSATRGPLLLVGFSMGAIIATAMAGQAPERVAGMVLAGYNAGADMPERYAARPAQQDAVRAGGLDQVLTGLLTHYFAAASSAKDDLSETVMAMGRALGPKVFVRQSEALRLRESRIAALASLACPVLYLVGAEDRLCPPAWHERWQAQTPNSALHVIAGAGHMVPLEKPQAFAAAITDWWRGP
jgi:pimeloyl-ACP methyl ester carboxylesterase